ncbi:MAG TPA: hypothetical protein VFA33_20620 [Bryobacteraceae bacterium]|nr:hypothetical protein [Bryobacteraceae bacterium]
MHWMTWLVSLGLIGTTTTTISFDSAALGRMPAGWSPASAVHGAAPEWHVVKDPTAPSPPYVMAPVSADAAGRRTPLAVLDQSDLRDGEISVRFKAVAGKEDRTAGLVWRYRDPNHYYVVCANSLHNNVEVFLVRDGKRIPLLPKGRRGAQYGVEHPVPSNVWGTLKVVFRGPVFSVYLNHRRIILTEDRNYGGPGKVGLWTENDSVTYFDDFQVLKRS